MKPQVGTDTELALAAPTESVLPKLDSAATVGVERDMGGLPGY